MFEKTALLIGAINLNNTSRHYTTQWVSQCYAVNFLLDKGNPEYREKGKTFHNQKELQ